MDAPRSAAEDARESASVSPESRVPRSPHILPGVKASGLTPHSHALAFGPGGRVEASFSPLAMHQLSAPQLEEWAGGSGTWTQLPLYEPGRMWGSTPRTSLGCRGDVVPARPRPSARLVVPPPEDDCDHTNTQCKDGDPDAAAPPVDPRLLKALRFLYSLENPQECDLDRCFKIITGEEDIDKPQQDDSTGTNEGAGDATPDTQPEVVASPVPVRGIKWKRAGDDAAGRAPDADEDNAEAQHRDASKILVEPLPVEVEPEVVALPPRGIKRKRDEDGTVTDQAPDMVADNAEAERTTRRLRRDASMILVGAAMTYAALACI